MSRVQVRDVIAMFQMMYNQHWDYKPNASERGCVDCSGAFHYTYAQLGGYMPHGSNMMARKYSIQFMPIENARSSIGLVPGMAVYKHRKPGEQYYDLPEKYKQGGSMYNGDLNDYYHVGLLDDDVGYVLNAQSEKTGFVRSPISKGWSHIAYLTDTDYNGGGEPTVDEKMIVSSEHAKEGTKTVNMRKKPSTNADLVEKVPFGSIVIRDSQDGDWSHITYDGKQGWMMSLFLEPYSEGQETDVPDVPDASEDKFEYVMNRIYKLEQQVEEIQQALSYITKVIENIDGGVG